MRDYSDYVLKIRKSEGGAVPAEPAVPAEDTAREKPRPAPAPARETAKDTSRSVPSRPAAGEKQAPAAGQGAKAPAAEQPLRYAVQVMASSKAVPLSSSQFRSYRGKVKEYASEGRFPPINTASASVLTVRQPRNGCAKSARSSPRRSW